MRLIQSILIITLLFLSGCSTLNDGVDTSKVEVSGSVGYEYKTNL